MRLSSVAGSMMLATTWSCGCVGTESPVVARGGESRIVSVDYCADQYLLRLVPRDRILAVSPDSSREFSFMRGAARGIPQTRPVAEDVLLLRPAIVLRAYGGGADFAATLERAGIQVVSVPFAETLDEIRETVQSVADNLGVAEEGRRVVAEMDARISAARRAPFGRTALYVTPSGFTAGRGTLIDTVISVGGFYDFESEDGWRPIPLERLAYDTPSLVVAAEFESSRGPLDSWSAFGHPVVRRAQEASPTLRLPGSWTACGAWFVADAIEAISRAADSNGAESR